MLLQAADSTTVQLDSLQAALERSIAALGDSIGAASGRVADALSVGPSPWQVGASLAGIAVAILASVELWRLARDARESKDRAAARVSAVAIPVRRSIKSWLDEMPQVIVQLESRERAKLEWSNNDSDMLRYAWQYWTNRSASGHIGRAEERIEALNEEAPFARPAVRDRVVRATAAFYQAFDQLNPLMAMPWSSNPTYENQPAAPDHRQQVVSGHERLRICVAELDGLISAEFKRATGGG